MHDATVIHYACIRCFHALVQDDLPNDHPKPLQATVPQLRCAIKETATEIRRTTPPLAAKHFLNFLRGRAADLSAVEVAFENSSRRVWM
jgi:hypothetical protein